MRTQSAFDQKTENKQVKHRGKIFGSRSKTREISGASSEMTMHMEMTYELELSRL